MYIEVIQEKYSNNLKSLFDFNIGGNLIYMWNSLDTEFGDKFTLDYKDKRKLFLELIEYYMRKGMLKFLDGEVATEIEKTIEKETYKYRIQKRLMWHERNSIEQTIAHFNLLLPAGDEDNFLESSDIHAFCSLCVPIASYYHDGTLEEYPQNEWIAADY